MRPKDIEQTHVRVIVQNKSLENLYVSVVPFRGQEVDPDRPDEVEPGGWELLGVSAGGRVRGRSVGSGPDAEEADAREVSERGSVHTFIQIYPRVSN